MKRTLEKRCEITAFYEKHGTTETMRVYHLSENQTRDTVKWFRKRRSIKRALKKSRNDAIKAAIALGIDPKTIGILIAKYRISGALNIPPVKKRPNRRNLIGNNRKYSHETICKLLKEYSYTLSLASYYGKISYQSLYNYCRKYHMPYQTKNESDPRSRVFRKRGWSTKKKAPPKVASPYITGKKPVPNYD